MNAYYKKKQIIARVNRNGDIIGKVEKWEAHKKGILHKALTVALIYNGQLIIQHRKHPAFDGVLDITSSSHQLFINGKLQSSEITSYDCLKREWNLSKTEIYNLKNIGSVYYKAKDENSEFKEHEVCDILVAKVKELPKPNFDFAYGFSLAKKEEISNKKGRIYKTLAPWVQKAIERKLL